MRRQMGAFSKALCPPLAKTHCKRPTLSVHNSCKSKPMQAPSNAIVCDFDPRMNFKRSLRQFLSFWFVRVDTSCFEIALGSFVKEFLRRRHVLEALVTVVMHPCFATCVGTCSYQIVFFLVLVRGHIFVAAYVSPFVLNWKTRQPTVNNTNVKMHSVCFAPTCFWCLWALAKNNYERLFNAAYSATNMWHVVMRCGISRGTLHHPQHFGFRIFASTVHLTRYYWRSTKWLHLGLGKTTVKHRQTVRQKMPPLMGPWAGQEAAKKTMAIQTRQMILQGTILKRMVFKRLNFRTIITVFDLRQDATLLDRHDAWPRSWSWWTRSF